MSLLDLRPHGHASLQDVQQAFAGRGWKAIIPNGLSDDLLLKLAQEFRALEQYMLDDDDSSQHPSLTVPFFVVIAFMSARHSSTVNWSLTLSERGMQLAMQVYLRELERVIVDRITGEGVIVEDGEFANEMEAAALTS